MMDDTQTKATNTCRLCLASLNTTSHIEIDLSRASEVRALVLQMYTVEVLPKDQVKSICIPCYKNMMTHYKNQTFHQNKKRIVHLNHTIQLKMMAANASYEIDAIDAVDAVLPKPVGDTELRGDAPRDKMSSSTSKQNRLETALAKETSNSRIPSPILPAEQNNNIHKSSVTKSTSRKKEVTIPTETVLYDKSLVTPSVTEERKKSHKSSVESSLLESNPGKPISSSSSKNDKNVSTSDATAQKKSGQKAPEKPSHKTSEKITEKPSEKAPEKVPKMVPSVSNGYLMPVVSVLDCLADPQYLKALFPLKISLNADEAKPLEYLCDNCFIVIKSEDEYRSHRQSSCASSCRYCYAHIKHAHSCAISSKYSVLNIKGSGKYCSKYKENTEETEAIENSKETSSKSKTSVADQNPKDSAPTKKSRPIKSCKKVSNKTRKNSDSSTTGHPGSRPAHSAYFSDSSSESSNERSTFIVSESDEELQKLVKDKKKKAGNKIKKVNRICD